MPITAMIALDVPDEELISRIIERGKSSGRSDDQDINKIATRLEVYRNETLPVANYYQEQGKYVAINGVGSIDEIFHNIKREIDKLIANQ